jgi:hypothetical protein
MVLDGLGEPPEGAEGRGFVVGALRTPPEAMMTTWRAALPKEKRVVEGEGLLEARELELAWKRESGEIGS